MKKLIATLIAVAASVSLNAQKTYNGDGIYLTPTSGDTYTIKWTNQFGSVTNKKVYHSKTIENYGNSSRSKYKVTGSTDYFIITEEWGSSGNKTAVFYISFYNELGHMYWKGTIIAFNYYSDAAGC